MPEQPEQSSDDFIEFYTAENGEYSWRRKAPNGQIVAGPEETFTTVESVRESAAKYAGDVTDHRDLF